MSLALPVSGETANELSVSVISGATNSILQLENVQASQNGRAYFVVVTDQLGSITSYVATLTVTPAPPLILTPPITQSAEIGSTVRLRVRASGSPPLIYQWYHDGTPALGATNELMILTDIQSVQGGVYTVGITNIAGSATSAAAFVSVISPVPRRIVAALLLAGQAGDQLAVEYRCHCAAASAALLPRLAEWTAHCAPGARRAQDTGHLAHRLNGKFRAPGLHQPVRAHGCLGNTRDHLSDEHLAALFRYVGYWPTATPVSNSVQPVT
jgi:hypothetical protein